MTTLRLLAFLLLVQISTVFSQSTFSKGTYLSFDDLKNSKPSQLDTFKIIKRTRFAIAMMGGNDYKVKTLSNGISRRFVRKKIYAISTGDSLFLNCSKLHLHSKYTLAEVVDGSLVFSAGIPSHNNPNFKHNPYMYGAAGGAIGGAKAALKRCFYKIDLQTGALSYDE